MITVTVTGFGSYVIPSSKGDELIAWLTENSSPMESHNKIPKGQTLLNETSVESDITSDTDNPYPVGSPQYYLYNIKDIHGN